MRLPHAVPGELDRPRDRTVDFSFEGRRYKGFAGDTITSALWASDVTVLGRSFKYHRPRGVLSLANHDVNAMVQDGARINVRADVRVPEPNPAGRFDAVNTFGGVAADRGRWIGKLAPFLPVGFYYKAFYSKRWFPRWERMFRNMSGLGKVDFSAPHVRTPKRYGFCDVLVIGAGPSGLSAALAAAEAAGPRCCWSMRIPPRRQRHLPVRRRRPRRPVQMRRSTRCESAPPSSHSHDDGHACSGLLRGPLGAARRWHAHHEDARPGGDHGDGLLRTTGRVPQQRPAGCDARLGGATPRLPICGASRRAHRRADRERGWISRRARHAGARCDRCGRHRPACVAPLRRPGARTAESSRRRGVPLASSCAHRGPREFGGHASRRRVRGSVHG